MYKDEVCECIREAGVFKCVLKCVNVFEAGVFKCIRTKWLRSAATQLSKLYALFSPPTTPEPYFNICIHTYFTSPYSSLSFVFFLYTYIFPLLLSYLTIVFCCFSPFKF